MFAVTATLATLLFQSCSQGQADKKPAEKSNLSQVFDTYWEENAKLFPLEATAQGDNRYNNILRNEGTKEFRDSLTQFYSNYLKQLNEYDRESLTENDRISYDIFKYDMESKLNGLA